MNFSVALIARNEAKTLPRLIKSLEQYCQRGGEVLLLDTGSTDDTVAIAKSLGCIVHEVGDKFRFYFDNEMAEKINALFIDATEEPIVTANDSVFDFAAARNYIAQFAKNDMIAMPDCDEIYTMLDLDAITNMIAGGIEQFEYQFVFAHDEFGNPLVKFLHSKFYDRRRLKWKGIIHEILSGNAKRILVPEDIIRLEHWQNPETNRGGYLKGLAYDVFLDPENDRNSHYFARELMYKGRFKSAIKEFERHIAMNKWSTEASQSMIFIGECFNYLGDPGQSLYWHVKAFDKDPTRREPLMKLAEHYYRTKMPLQTVAYTKAALEIKSSGFYANYEPYYQNRPYELLYWAYWQLGEMDHSKENFFKAFNYLPYNSKYLHDLRFYTSLPGISVIIPTLGRPEGLKKCLESIKKLNYPEELIEVIIKEDLYKEGVPLLVDKAYRESSGDYIVYGSNDVEFTPDSIIIAIYELLFLHTDKKLLAFNTGTVLADEGNICEHFIIDRALVEEIGGKIFDTDFHHVGVDNLLWFKCKKLNKAFRSEKSVVIHHHFSTTGKFDHVYELGWKNVQEDRILLEQKINEINNH